MVKYYTRVQNPFFFNPSIKILICDRLVPIQYDTSPFLLIPATKMSASGSICYNNIMNYLFIYLFAQLFQHCFINLI